MRRGENPHESFRGERPLAFGVGDYIWASTAVTFGRAQLLHLGEHSYYIWASTAASAGAQELRTEVQGSAAPRGSHATEL